MNYRIKNWDKFQHFKNRRPPWIKLHREILDQPGVFAGGFVSKHGGACLMVRLNALTLLRRVRYNGRMLKLVHTNQSGDFKPPRVGHICVLTLANAEAFSFLRGIL